MNRKNRQRAKRKQQAQKKRSSVQAQRPSQEEFPRQAGPQPNGWRLWLFRLLGVFVIPALLLIGFEMGLRAFGYGVPTGFTFKQKIDGEKRILSNPYFTWRFFEPQLAREISHFSLPLKKAEGVYRVFVLGGSAAQGSPVPAYGITRMLDTMLRNQYPGVDFEVINAAITAINSHVVLPIARDLSRLEPDLFVIYLGNNEVVGPYGAGTVFSPLASNLSVIRTGIALKTTRLGQLISNTMRKMPGRGQAQPTRWGGMEMFLNHQVRATDTGMKTVYHHFEQNLLDISRVAQESGIPIIVSTVGVNLRNIPPFASLHHPDLSEQETQEWEKIVAEGEALQEQSRFEEAVERFLQAERIDADYAALQFRLGRCYSAMRDPKKSKARYVKARELDALRFRTDIQINEIIRRVAGGKSGQGIYLVDSSQILDASSPEQTPGNELFYEHVHLNFSGTYLVAHALFEKVQDLLPEWVSRHASGDAVLPEQEVARRLAYTGWNRLTIAEGLLEKIQAPPFTNQLYSNERVNALSDKIATLKDRYARSEGKQEALAQYKTALDEYDTHWRLHHAYAEFQHRCFSNAREAEKHLKLAIKQCPQSSVELSLLAEMLSAQGKYIEAEKYHRLALTYNPRSTLMLFNFAFMLMEQGKYDGAIPYLQETVEIDPHNAMFHSTLGLALKQSNDKQSLLQAVWHLEKAVAIKPDHIQGRTNLANHYANQAKELLVSKEIDRAIELLQKAVALTPDAATERYYLAVLLNREGDPKAAAEHLAEVLRIDPSHEKARKLFRLLRAVSR